MVPATFLIEAGFLMSRSLGKDETATMDWSGGAARDEDAGREDIESCDEAGSGEDAGVGDGRDDSNDDDTPTAAAIRSDLKNFIVQSVGINKGVCTGITAIEIHGAST